MKKAAFCLMAGLCAAAVFAQQPTAPAGPIGIADGLKNQHRNIRRNLAASADKMAEADYAFKPQGVAPEVRTFGQLLIHVTNANNNACSRAKGEAAKPRIDEKATMTKAEIVKALNEALTYCDGVYDAQTSTTVSEMIKLPNGGEVARANGLFGNISHNNESYGTMVVYMRLKGLVPPSSEGR